ncbi:LAGLIDADG family homing endonuclease [Halalkalibacillus halophilus]|uniref:LAGLIDADG family homing endonuclease n=1 Tax=Halalkalibacillus halophilus TaxID=392827 RepID=UPI000424A473|nr:LAGLIDADG family homing endonuclease [Halalkalibacillus halophilus]
MKELEAAYLAGIIDGEGTITLTKWHKNEHRKPIISIASTDIELLEYLKELTNGKIYQKKNYNPSIHKTSFFITIKNKNDVFYVLKSTVQYLRVPSKKARAKLILNKYNLVTLRNGKYSDVNLKRKLLFEEEFLNL